MKGIAALHGGDAATAAGARRQHLP